MTGRESLLGYIAETPRIAKPSDDTRSRCLPSINQNVECPRNRRPLRAWMLRGWRRRWREIDRIHEQVVGDRIQAHGFGAVFGLHRFYLAEFVRRVLVEDMDHPVAR